MDKENKMFWIGFASSLAATIVALYVFERYVTEKAVENAITKYIERTYNVKRYQYGK